MDKNQYSKSMSALDVNSVTKKLGHTPKEISLDKTNQISKLKSF